MRDELCVKVIIDSSDAQFVFIILLVKMLETKLSLISSRALELRFFSRIPKSYWFSQNVEIWHSPH